MNTVKYVKTDSLYTKTDSEKLLVISLWIDIFIYRLLFIMLLFNVDSAKKKSDCSDLAKFEKNDFEIYHEIKLYLLLNCLCT